jgi:hypothetical protein
MSIKSPPQRPVHDRIVPIEREGQQ